MTIPDIAPASGIGHAHASWLTQGALLFQWMKPEEEAPATGGRGLGPGLPGSDRGGTYDGEGTHHR